MKQKEKCFQSGKRRVGKTQLCVGRSGNFPAHDGNFAGFIGQHVKAKGFCLGQHKAVAAKGGIHENGAVAFDFQRHLQTVGKGGNIAQRDAVGLAIAAVGGDFNEAGGCFKLQMRHRLNHGDDAGIEKDRCHADAIGARHGRRVFRLHDDEAHLRLGVLGRHQQVHMAKHAAAGLIQDEIAQRLVAGDEARLFPDRVAGRRRHAAHDDIAHLAFGMAVDDVDGLYARILWV